MKAESKTVQITPPAASTRKARIQMWLMLTLSLPLCILMLSPIPPRGEDTRASFVISLLIWTPTITAGMLLFSADRHRFNPLKRWHWLIVVTLVLLPFVATGLSSPLIPVIMAAAALIILSLLVIGTIARWRGAGVTLDDNGVFIRTQTDVLLGRPGSRFRWDEFETIRMFHHGRYYIAFNGNWILSLIATAGERRIYLNDAYDNSVLLVLTASRYIVVALLNKMEAALLRDNSFAMGDVVFTPEGIRRGRRSIAWADFKRVALSGRNLLLMREDGTNASMIEDFGKLPNGYLLQAWIERLQQRFAPTIDASEAHS